MNEFDYLRRWHKKLNFKFTLLLYDDEDLTELAAFVVGGT